MNNLPLDGLIVLDFSQYLSGPSASLRLADMGARVIKIERPGSGDAGRKLAIKDLWVDDNSLLFHTINRNKESFAANLKDGNDLQLVKQLIGHADIMIHNFRPEVMAKIGLDYEAVSKLYPGIIYGEISGYGKEGPWKDKPGQDLLLQSVSGLAYTTGNGTNGPVPFGISIGDMIAGAQLAQGILAAIIRRQKTGTGAYIEISMLESLLDFQFELLTTFYATGQQPQRSKVANGQPLLSAPYGIYETADGYLAIAMMDIHTLAETIGCNALLGYQKQEAFAKRDEIKAVLAEHLKDQPTKVWLSMLHEADLWAMQVLNWQEMAESSAYKALQMEQTLNAGNAEILTTRCPIRFNKQLLKSEKAAPSLGADTQKIIDEFELSISS